MTKRLSVINYAAALVALLLTIAPCASAQGRARQDLPPAGQRDAERQRRNDPLFGRRADRMPGNKRGVEGFPQGDRQRQRDPAQKRLMQQRLMQAIGITQEQRQRMQEIRRGFEDEAISAGRRVREARRGLDRAIMGEQFDEQLINQRAEELALAQADMIRLQARMRARVRGVLTTEQVMRFNELERRLRQQQREQREQERQMGMQDRAPSQFQEIDLVALLLF